MKNSPHRREHERKKTLRKSTKLQSKAPQNSPEVPYKELHSFQEELKPTDEKRSREILEIYKKYFERRQQTNKPKHSKRTTPGDVDRNTPYTKIQHLTNRTIKRWEKANLQQSKDLTRKIEKYQNNHFRKAA